MTNPVQICPSPISLELLKLFQGIACNNERLEGGPWGPELLGERHKLEGDLRPIFIP